MSKGVPTRGRRAHRDKIQAVTGFGARIRELRNERDWSQQRVGILANVDPSYISMLETGLAAPPSREVLGALARAFELDHGATVDLALRAASEWILVGA